MIDWLFIHTPLYLMTQSFWQDEAFSFFMARLPLVEILKATAQDFNPPLYYFLLHFWMNIFGTSEVSIRSMSLIFFAGSAYIFSLFLETILHLKEKRAFIYSVLFLLNPYLLYYAFEGRMYSLFAFLSILSFYFFVKKNQKGFIIATLLGLYTHYFFILNTIVQFIYIILFEKKEVKTRIMPLVLSYLAFLPWMIFAFPKIFAHSAATWIKPTKIADLKALLAVLYTGNEPYWSFYTSRLTLVSILIGIIIIAGLYFQKKRTSLFWLLTMWSFLFFIFVMMVSFVRPIFVPRYLIFAPVGFMIFLVYLIEGMPKKIQLISFVVLFAIMINYTIREISFKRKGDMRKNVVEIKNLMKDHDEVYVVDPIHYFTVLYYLQGKSVYILKSYNDLPDYLGKILIPRIATRSYIPASTERAFVIEGNNAYSLHLSY